MITGEKHKPKHRSDIRILLGKSYYRLRRYCDWLFDDKKYSKRRLNKAFIHEIAEHSSPLYRQLKDVDMWLQENKVINLKQAIKKLDGIVIEPGETFSYWKSIGRPMKIKGYKNGMILHYGKFKSGTGGGLCQMSNLLYWMFLHTPLEVTERHRHSYDVFPDSKRTQPFGSGATCVYNYRDLQVINNTSESYQINLKIEDGRLMGAINSDASKHFRYTVYEKSHQISHEYWGGYMRHNHIRRKVHSIDNEILCDEFVCENHALMMYEPFLESPDM